MGDSPSHYPKAPPTLCPQGQVAPTSASPHPAGLGPLPAGSAALLSGPCWLPQRQRWGAAGDRPTDARVLHVGTAGKSQEVFVRWVSASAQCKAPPTPRSRQTSPASPSSGAETERELGRKGLRRHCPPGEVPCLHLW